MATALRLIEGDELGLTPELRAFADAKAARIRALALAAVENAVEMGRELAATRDALPRGCFVRWLDAEFNMSTSTAYNYMALAEKDAVGELPTVGKIRLRDFYRATNTARLADDDCSPHDGDEAPEPRPPREDVRQILIDSLRRELEAVRSLADDARMVAAMLGDAWNHLVGQARALDRSRNVANASARGRVSASPAIDEVQRRRLLLLDDPTLEKLATAWSTAFTTSARVFAEMQGEDVSFDQVRYYQKVVEALQRGA